MADVDREMLAGEIERLAQRMGAHLMEFRNRSEFAQQRGQLSRLAERHRQFRLRFEAAQGPDWESAKNDLAREHGELAQELVKFEQKLDRSERLQSGRVPGAKSGLG